MLESCFYKLNEPEEFPQINVEAVKCMTFTFRESNVWNVVENGLENDQFKVVIIFGL